MEKSKKKQSRQLAYYYRNRPAKLKYMRKYGKTKDKRNPKVNNGIK